MTLSRRELLQGLASAGLCASTVACKRGRAKLTQQSEETSMSERVRMPVVYLPHGGGPWPYMDASAFGPASMYDRMAEYLRRLGTVLPAKPSALLVVSAHWEESVPTVMTSVAPPMLYDYSGFPPETYEVSWPAPGDRETAERVLDELRAKGMQVAEDPERGFDHGTFVPMGLTYPKADVPTFQLSLRRGLDPAEHIEIGRAIASLRDDGVFIVGSGMSYHNMHGFFGRVPTMVDDSRAFDDWMVESVARGVSDRDRALVEWERAPRARECHPREEHLLPLMVCAGAAEGDAGTAPYRDVVLGAHVSAVHFG